MYNWSKNEIFVKQKFWKTVLILHLLYLKLCLTVFIILYLKLFRLV